MQNKQLQADRHALIHVMPPANMKLFQIMYAKHFFFLKGWGRNLTRILPTRKYFCKTKLPVNDKEHWGAKCKQKGSI